MYFRILKESSIKKMSIIRLNDLDNGFWRHLISRCALVLFTIAIIVISFPRSQDKIFHYDKGKPWMYGQLIAKFDFPIFKTEQTINHERDSIKKQFIPYFDLNKNIEKKNIKKFLSDYKDGIPGLPPIYLKIIIKKLDEIYNKGIINSSQFNTLWNDSSKTIYVINGKEAINKNVHEVLTNIGAYEYFFTTPQLSNNRTIIQQCNIDKYIEPNLIYDKNRSETELNDMLSLIPQASGMVLEGQRIIDRGDIVDSKTYMVLNSFEKATKKRSDSEDKVTATIIGQTIQVLILVVLFTVYLALFRHKYFYNFRSILLLYSIMIIFPILTSLIIKHNILSVYILPIAMGAIFIRIFMDTRTAFALHIITVLISAIAVKYQYEFIVTQVIAGLVGIYSLKELSKRSQIFLTALMVTIGYFLSYLSILLLQTASFNNLDISMYYHFAINGFLLLFIYPLMLVIEKSFGFVSTVTLFELSNTNNTLLRKLSEVAPGTFQHSITVGNLATEIANKIGANGQLVRTGALYHDIGKMKNPAFFTENQAGINPHDKISDIESAKIIISHVTDGLKMAEEHNLPKVIKDFITTHHGKGLAKYFYINYKNKHPNEAVDPTPFQYPGPNPSTKEQAILMMCDSVEAASRSLTEYTEESISNLVNRIIDYQLKERFFKDCPITFRDIEVAKIVLIERLKAIYHTRVQYPKLKS